MKRKLNILVCPLNWGLGHASRDIPIISEFVKREHNVIIAGSENPIEIIRTEFPNLKFVKFSGFNISYPNNGSFVFYFLLRIRVLLWRIFKEHIQLKKIIIEQKIDVVISDNRYGLWNKNVYSIFITHQINIKIPIKCKLLEHIVNSINHYFINKYDLCWVPDFEKPPFLAGELSHKKNKLKNIAYTGLLSKFLNYPAPKNNNEKKFEIVAIISGPEPHRTFFENILTVQFQTIKKSCLIVNGTPLKITKTNVIGNVEIVSHLSTNDLYNVINNSKYIVSRAGYTTIMDLIALKRTAILVPTPGQTEQEYLADYYSEKKMFLKMIQKKFDINEALKNINKYSPIIYNENCNLLNKEIDKIEKQLIYT
ncbi:MAG: hypothetical protein COS14_12800 [Bacteroidetes bacterium CG02_land_8_20_14_3_00_31_25]|nr:MAG: hypothetical protein COX07_03650 [Bacteroidetes bacterium CG23_combo_of_CG06-09_8_20_14_all_32_9]PIV57826.1 MAG: hypothetical protein COS14_12800 [Bacteroidetes bacterium CG02_land_8_20_14_3_00_31_25]PIY03580.1 MAG: hypothetical protein COZ21_08805 [Bacteroidetes bacterium CG_4_10_14_3_um_filter_31_20]